MTVWAVLTAALLGVAVGMVAGRARRAGVPVDPAAGDDDLPAQAIARSPIAHLVVDAQGRAVFANDRAREWGLVVGDTVDSVLADAAARTLVSGEPMDVDFRVRPAPRPPASRSAPMLLQAGVLALDETCALVTASDESAAVRLDLVRRDFVTNVSHELKTPVAAIALLAEALSEAGDDPEATRRFAGRMGQESRRLISLVQELILLSRLEGADPLPDLQVVPVDAVITEAVALTARTAETAGITVAVGPPSGLLVRGDRNTLVTAMKNLIENALHYSPAHTPVSISATGRDETVHIAVTDRGIGIAPEHHDRVFERFFRVDPARSRETGGTGLGLAIVKHVAVNHGGTAALWSRPGTGSTFSLRLPQLQPPPPTAAGPSAPGGATATPAPVPAVQGVP